MNEPVGPPVQVGVGGRVSIAAIEQLKTTMTMFTRSIHASVTENDL